MATLYLFTTKYPYGSQETFLENEIVYLSKKFDVILIYPLYKASKDEPYRQIPSNVEVRLGFLSTSQYNRLFKFVYSLNLKVLWCFFLDLKKHKVFKNRQHLLAWCSWLINATVINNSKSFKEIKECDEGVFYFYWGVGLANMVNMLPLNKEVIKAVRLHGGDVYLERSGGYIPLREIVYTRVNFILAISNDICFYLGSRYSDVCKKVLYAPLGTEFKGKNIIDNSETITIVSCSNLIALKRVHLIIEALLRIRDVKIVYHHFGDGPLFSKLLNFSKQLPSNINCHFHGRVTNEEVLNFYSSQSVDIVVNLSLHEGVPVSLMEAMSFGIPCVATDVGATKELVDDENGILLPVNFSVEELANIFKTCKQLHWKYKREIAYQKWSSNFNAKYNYECSSSLLFESTK